MKKIKIEIDGKKLLAKENQNLIEVAREHGIDIPTLCYYKDMGTCLGTCRVCAIKVDGKTKAACTLSAQANMQIEINTEELIDMRKALVELLFIEGNHFCPSCEKSGDCHLQARAYKMQITVPRFPYRFNNREIDFSADKILFEHNRCILCKRCTEKFIDDKGRRVFSFSGKGSRLNVEMDIHRANRLSEQKIDEVVALCPVGAILKKGKGFDRPVGSRQYDIIPIGVGNE